MNCDVVLGYNDKLTGSIDCHVCVGSNREVACTNKAWSRLTHTLRGHISQLMINKTKSEIFTKKTTFPEKKAQSPKSSVSQANELSQLKRRTESSVVGVDDGCDEGISEG
jgi:hypothetical protein